MSNKWGMMADVHIRRNNGVKDPSFYFARIGADYWVHDKWTIAAGYAHLWLAPTVAGWHTFSNEHRLFQQTAFLGTAGKTGLVHRLRNEQRWMQKMRNDKPSGDWKFTNRVRYLINLNFPLARTHGKLSIVVADEIFLQLGKEVVFNTFDQNRIFVGIKNRLNNHWSYDIGYMNVYQQKANGYQYDMNHTFRWFFYFTPDYRKKQMEQHHASLAGLE